MAPVAIVVGLVMELLKYVNLLVWPWLQAKLNAEYLVFQHSVTILIWSFAVAIVVLAGAHWTARQDRRGPAGLRAGIGGRGSEGGRRARGTKQGCARPGKVDAAAASGPRP